MQKVFVEGEEDQNKGLAVRFFMHAEKDERRSEEEGRPIYQEIEMIEVLFPGSKDVLHEKLKWEHTQRFPKLYKQFVDTKESKISGTPLAEFPFISVAERRELEYFNIFTAEQLVNMPDGNVNRIGVNGRDLIKKVDAYMKSTKDKAHITKTAQQNEELKREIDLLKQQMSNLLKHKGEENGEGTREIRKDVQKGSSSRKKI